MKTELEDAGLDAEDMAETTSTLQKKLLALTHGKVDIMLNADEIKSTYDILKEFAAVYDEMTDAEQAAAMELMGGKVQANVLASLVKNFEQAEKVIEVSANSAGSALAENEKYLDSIAGKMSQFTNATENFWITLISSETVKKVIDFGTGLMDVLTGVADKVGIFSAALPLLVGGLGNFAIQLFSQKTYLKQLVPELGKQAAATKLVGEAAKEGVVQLLAAKVAADGFGASIKQLGTHIAGLLKPLMGLVAAHPVISLVAGSLIALGTAIAIVYDKTHTSHKEAVESLQNTSSELEDVKSEFSSLESELEATKNRLAELYELQNQGGLSFVEQNELELLKQQNQELERKQYLLKQQQQYLSKKNAYALIDVYQTDDTLNKSSDYYQDESGGKYRYAEYVQKDGSKYVLDRHEDTFHIVQSIGNEIDKKILDLDIAKKSEEKATNALANAYKKNDEKQVTSAITAHSEAVQKTLDAEEALVSLADTYREYLNDAEYFYKKDGEELEDWQKKSNEAYTSYLNNIDKIYMAMGSSGAKESFISRIFGVQGTEQARSIRELAVDGADLETLKRYISDDHGIKNLLREYDVSLDDTAEYLLYLVQAEKKQMEQEKKVASTIARSTKSLSALTAGYEKYNTAVDVQNELLHDGMVTSEEYYNSLLEFIGDETKLGQAIDKNNGYLVTNADLLNDIIEEKKDEQLSNVRLARSQAKIKYAELAKNLTKVLNTSTKYNSTSKKTISSLKDQIRAVQNVIENYDRLEDQYLGTYSMFERFEDAATIDTETDTLSKFLDMLNAIREGLGTGQLGTKQFATAVEHLIPDEYLDGLESASEYAQQIAKYLTVDLGSYITLDDGNFEINDDNVIALIQQAIDNGHFVGTVDSFEIADGVQPDQLAESWGTTYDGAVAFLGAIDRYNISSESLLSQMDDTIEGRYGRLTEKMLAFAEAKERLLAGHVTEGLIAEEELKRVQEDIDALDDEYASLYDEAIKYASEYYKADAELAKNQQRLTEVETELTSALANEWSQKFVELDNERLTLEQEIADAQKQIDELHAEGYTDSIMPIAVEGLDQQISSGMTELAASMQKLNELIANNEDGQYDRVIAKHEQLIEEKQAELAELSTKRDAYQDIYIEKEETILDVMENIEEFTIGDKTFKVAMDGCEDVEKAIEKIIEELERLTDIKVTVDVEQEEESKLPKKIYTNKDGTLARTKVGYAKAYGTSRDLEGDLVGELGRETVVDPHRGIYYTVGDNGAELVDLPKDAIVFNHKQTEEIFKKGHTNSRGKAFASGNAYPNGISSGNDLFGSNNDSDSDSSDPFEDTIDFVEIKLQELADAIEDLNARIENAVGYETKNQLIDEVIANYRQQLSDISSAIEVYTQKAAEEFAKIPEEYTTSQISNLGELKKALKDAGDEYNSLINGNVDYNKRPVISATKMQDIYPEFDMDYATTYSQYHTIGEGEFLYTIDITPILEDGTVLTDDELADYINHLVTDNGIDSLLESDVNNLIINVSPGDYDEAYWNSYQEKLREVKEEHIDLWQQIQDAQKQNMVQNGAFEVKDFVGDEYEDVVDAINNYREWAQKVDELNRQLETTKTEISDIAKTKLDNIISDFEALASANEAHISAIEAIVSIRETQGLEVTEDYYERMIPWQEAELNNLRQKKALLEQTLQEQIALNNIPVGSAQYNESMSEIYAAEQEIADMMNTIAETTMSISETKFGNMADLFDERMKSVQVESEQLQANISLLEEQGEYVSAHSYSRLSELSEQELSMLRQKKEALLEILDIEVNSGRLAAGSDQYNEMVDQIYEIDSAIMDAKTSIEEFQNAINDLHWENFDKLLTRLGYIESEIQHVANLMSDEKMVTDDGEWTEEGITALAMQAQAMETARYQAAQYAEAIEQLERTRDRYSEEEYITKLNELTEGQWECIEAYESAKDAIVDLNSSRIEAVKNGIQKEIDAYAELIELAKEELNAKKALRDFEKNINSQTTAIAELERQIAARAGSTDAATIAERKKLEAELLKAKEALNDTYYDNAVTSQEQALDEELAAYNKAKDAELEALELTLENVERIVAEAFDVIKINAEVVMGQLNEINDEYGINLSDALTLPWTDGQYAIDNYTGHFLDAGGSFTDELDRIKDKWEELQKQADATAVSMLEAINADIRDTVDHTTTKKPDVKENGFKITEEDSGEGFVFHEEPDEGNYQAPYSESETNHESESQVASLPSVNDLVTVKPDTTDWSRDGGNGTKMHAWVPGSDFYVRKVQGDEVELSKYKGGAPTGWVKLKDLVGYASGTSNVKKDQLAWLDELGEEIVLNAGPDGRIQYLTKGSAVIPHDASEKLMELSQLDPTEVLNRSRPVIGAPGYTDARVEFDISFGSLVHVDSVSEDTLPKLKTLVRDEFDSLMKNVNSGLKKFVR